MVTTSSLALRKVSTVNCNTDQIAHAQERHMFEYSHDSLQHVLWVRVEKPVNIVATRGCDFLHSDKRQHKDDSAKSSHLRHHNTLILAPQPPLQLTGSQYISLFILTVAGCWWKSLEGEQRPACSSLVQRRQFQAREKWE